MSKSDQIPRHPSKLSADRMQFLNSRSSEETEEASKPTIAPKKPVLRRLEEQSNPECQLKFAREKLKNVEFPSKENESPVPKGVKSTTQVQKSSRENANVVENPNEMKETVVQKETPSPAGVQLIYPKPKKTDCKPGENKPEPQKAPPSPIATTSKKAPPSIAATSKKAPPPIATTSKNAPPSPIATKSEKTPPPPTATKFSKDKPRQLKTELKPNEAITSVDKPSEKNIESPPPIIARQTRPTAVTQENHAKKQAGTKIFRSQDNEKIGNHSSKEQPKNGQEWKSYRLLTLPKTDSQVPRKPARPPSVNLNSFSSQQEKRIPVREQPQPIESESEEEAYEELDAVAPKSVRPISLLTEEQEEEEERKLATSAKPLPPLPTEELYDDAGMPEDDDDGELYQELD